MNSVRSTFRVLAIALACTAGLVTGEALALKIDSHVYISQQVLNDVVDDGQISIDVGGQIRSFPVDPAIVSAIRQNPSYFRMGSLGPDAFPGVIAGQMVIHPGDESPFGWGTGDWLSHIESSAKTPEEQAFAAGYKVHAATDAFSHTYVNHYSGDVWELKGETHVEARHFILESFIASKNPPITNELGASVGSPLDAIRAPSGELAIPEDFIARTLIFTPEAGRYSSGAPHLSFMASHERNIARSIEKAENIAIEIDRLTVFFSTGILANKEEVRELRDLARKIGAGAIPFDEVERAIGKIQDIRKNHAAIPADVLGGLLSELSNVYKEYARLQGEMNKAALDAASISDKINSSINACQSGKAVAQAVCKTGTRSLCEKLKLGKKACGALDVFDPSCMATQTRIYHEALRACENIHDAVQLRPLLAAAIEAKNKAELESLGLGEQLRSVASEIENLTVTQIELETALMTAALNMAELSLSDINAVVASLKTWHSGIRRAGVRYVHANAQAMINALSPDGDPLAPLMEWVSCYGPVLAGIPHPLMDAACAVDDARTKALASLKRVLESLAKIDIASRMLLETVEKLEKEIAAIITEAVIDAVETVAGAPVKELLAIIKKPGSVEAVTLAFTEGESLGLRSIPDAAYRVAAEMGITESRSFFDQDKFHVVYNSVVLSKLSLLSSRQLNKLAEIEGVAGQTSYGSALYNQETRRGSNVLTGALRSIDGSFHWYERGMPFLRRWGHEHPPVGRYTFLRSDDPENGFRLWRDERARDQLFRRIFRGPMIAGIDAPEVIAFPPLLLEKYPYKVCEQNPWPLENSPSDPDVSLDNTCTPNTLESLFAPDSSRRMERMDTVMSVHKAIAPPGPPAEKLTEPVEWHCLSADRASRGAHRWSIKFYPDGLMRTNVTYTTSDLKTDVSQSATADADFKIVGDFLFAFPRRAGVIESRDAPKAATLDRRFTSQPQRYWMQLPEDGELLLTNHDGTKLACVDPIRLAAQERRSSN